MSNLPFSVFVTGTDTETGKTLVSAALLHILNQAGVKAVAMKPVAAGAQMRDDVRYNEDIALLRAQSGSAIPAQWMTPYLWDEPIAPHIAARKQGVVMRTQVIEQAYEKIGQHADAVIVEGVGGFYVPLSDQQSMADVAAKLGLPVVLVVGLRLGCINHALLTAQAVQSKGLTLAGWVVNTIDASMPYQAENIQTLQNGLKAPYLGCIPRMTEPTAQRAAGFIDVGQMVAWGSLARVQR